MTNYIFDVYDSLTEITANRNFQSACFDSVRGGNPLTIHVTDKDDKSEQEITCLEYILDAIANPSDVTPIVDDEFFENLATIDIRGTKCHIRRHDASGKYDTVATCMPKIIDAYSAVSKHGNFALDDAKGHTYVYGSAEAKEKVKSAMGELVSKYPDLLLENNCYVSIPRNKYNKYAPGFYGYVSCFEKLMYEGSDVDFIDASSLPSDFFDNAKCHTSTSNPDPTPCIETIIENARSVKGTYGYNIFNDNCKSLLESVISSKKFAKSVFNPNSKCGDMKCIDALVSMVSGTSPCSVATLLLFSNSDSDGIVDTESEESLFSGLKCANSTNCLDLLVGNVLKAHDGGGGMYLKYVSDIIRIQPRYSGACGSLLLSSLLEGASNKSEAEALADDISKGFNSRYKFLDKAATETCISAVGGKEHSVNGVDYAIELGTPVLYNLSRGGMSTKDFYDALSGVSCNSIYTGEPMPCMQKLTKELMTTKRGDIYSMSPVTSDIITRILNSGSDAYDYTFPDGFPWFTDYLSEGLLHSVILGSDDTRLGSMQLLEKMVNAMGTYYAYTQKLIDSDSFPRMKKIGDIVYEAYDRDSKSGYNRKNLIKKPAAIKHILNNCFAHDESDVMNIIDSKLFNRGLAIPSFEVLSSWYYEFEDSPFVTNAILGAMRENEDKIKMAILGKITKESGFPDDAISPDALGNINVTQQMVKLYELAYGSSINDIIQPS
jgi:hypothetical protein